MKASGGKEAAEGNKGCFLPTMSRKGRQRYLWKLALNLVGRESARQTRSNTEHDVKLVCARVSVSKDTQMRGGRRSAGSEKEWRRSEQSFFPFLSLVPSSSLSLSLVPSAPIRKVFRKKTKGNKMIRLDFSARWWETISDFWQCMLFVWNAQVIVWNNFLYFQGPKAAPRMKPGKNSPKKKTNKKTNKKTKKTKYTKKKKPWEERENVSDLVAIGFDLTSDCLRGWHGFFFDQSQSEVKPEHCNYDLFPTLNENLLLCDLKVYLRIFWNFRNCHCDFGVQCIVSGTVVSFTRPADLGQEKTPRWLVGRWTTGTGIIRTPCTFCFLFMSCRAEA